MDSEYLVCLTQERSAVSAYYSNRLSYHEVAALVERHCGARVLSDQTIWQLVQHHAQQASDTIFGTAMQRLVTTPSVEVAGRIDLYDANETEVVLFDDGIGVKPKNRSANLLVRLTPEQSTRQMSRP